MNENQTHKLNEKQIWTIVITVLPVAILMNAGNLLSDQAGMRIVYAGVFGGIGGLLGFISDYLTKEKGRIIKVFTILGLILICTSVLYFMKPQISDEDILNQIWVTQQIGNVEIDSPFELTQESTEPLRNSALFSEANIHTYHEDGRLTLLIQSRITQDTLFIRETFRERCEGILSNFGVNTESIQFEELYADEEELSSLFIVPIDGEKAYGFGFLYWHDDSLESVWLIPVDRGFSRDYIESFEEGIIVDYQ